jgi:superoxide dismutase, Cu-Zn family
MIHRRRHFVNKSTRLAALLLTPVLVGGAAFATLPTFAETAQQIAATAEIKDASGQVAGSATFRPTLAGEVRVQVKLRGFNAAVGDHGIHIHAVGRCEAPGFTTAGGHFNPATHQHGFLNPLGYHAGDLPNLTLNDDGNATFNYNTYTVSLERGVANSLFDADGSAVVIHAGPDDLRTDPAGNSGARIACGVIEPVESEAAGANGE